LRVSIDTCVLLDLLLDSNVESVKKIQRHYDDHDALMICGLVYGELYPALLKSNEDIDHFLSDLDIKLAFCDRADYQYAGEKWNEYTRRRKFVCPACGKTLGLKCDKCRKDILFRQHILADFIIGAFSEKKCDGLLTRDHGYYRTYFPELKLL